MLVRSLPISLALLAFLCLCLKTECQTDELPPKPPSKRLSGSLRRVSSSSFCLSATPQTLDDQTEKAATDPECANIEVGFRAQQSGYNKIPVSAWMHSLPAGMDYLENEMKESGHSWSHIIPNDWRGMKYPVFDARSKGQIGEVQIDLARLEGRQPETIQMTYRQYFTILEQSLVYAQKCKADARISIFSRIRGKQPMMPSASIDWQTLPRPNARDRIEGYFQVRVPTRPSYLSSARSHQLSPIIPFQAH